MLDIEVPTPRVYVTNANGVNLPMVEWEKQRLGDMIQRMQADKGVTENKTVPIIDKLGKHPSRKKAFNQAKIDAGIPKSASPVKQGWVNVNNSGKSGEPESI